MLQGHIVDGSVVFARDDTDAQLKLLWSAKSGGGRNQIRGKAAGQIVARRTGCERERAQNAHY
jgi:hypothetical protein